MPRRKIQAAEFEAAVPPCASDVSSARGRSLPAISRQIRLFREQRALEQKELAARLGVTPNAVSNWENGRSRPDFNLLLPICRALNISLYTLLGEESSASVPTAAEQQLLERCRRLSAGHRYAVEQLIDSLLLTQQEGAVPPVRRLIYFEKQLAAGFGDPSEFDGAGVPVYAPSTPDTERADYIFPVSGDSMEPRFHDGDKVLVSRAGGASAFQRGEIGAFIIGNETYIKVYSPEGLVSLNPAYPVMRFAEEAAPVYLIGRVIGTLKEDVLISHPEAEALRLPPTGP